ncbi:peptidase C39 family protein [Oceanimonas sp. NS1]|nr:peptidase C39 family protein [Oceanimonas sp. NS1]
MPYYRQTTEFTCGPASLMMALSALDATHHTQPDEELQLWREATTIFMTQGHGGCGPHGLALAAHRRGFAVELVLNQDGPLFINSVRSPDKKWCWSGYTGSFSPTWPRPALCPVMSTSPWSSWNRG